MNDAESGPSRAPAGEKPFVIAAFIGTQTLGNFVMNHLVAAAIAREIPGSRMAAIFRNDRPYKAFINLCNPFVDRTVGVDANPEAAFALDWFDGNRDAPGRPFDAAWYEDGYHDPDLVLTPSMLDIWGCKWPAPGFRIPEELAPALGETLKARGLIENKWFACIHMRESGYKWREGADADRNVNPEDYLAMIRHIIEEQGGQVVRIGHPEMTPLPEIDGLFDLSRIDDNFPEQAFAVSRARYFIGTDTGPTQLAAAFQTPTASTNALGIDLWNPGDVVMLRHVTDEAGVPIPREDLIEVSPILGNHRPHGVRYHANTPCELIEVADHMYRKTDDCPGWRDFPGQPDYTPSGTLKLPLEWGTITERGEIGFWPPEAG